MYLVRPFHRFKKSVPKAGKYVGQVMPSLWFRVAFSSYWNFALGFAAITATCTF